MKITNVMNFGVVSYFCVSTKNMISYGSISFRKIESSALFIPLLHKPPIFQNPNLMDEWLNFGILSILNKIKKKQNKRSINSADNTIYLSNKILFFNNLLLGCEQKNVD